MLLCQEQAVKRARHFGYEIWVSNFLKTEFVGCSREMSEKLNGDDRKLDWQTPWYITRKGKIKSKREPEKGLTE